MHLPGRAVLKYDRFRKCPVRIEKLSLGIDFVAF